MKVKHPNPDAYFQFARNMVKGMAKNFPAPAKCVDAVEAAVKRKFDDGMVYEREVFTGADAHARVQGAAPCLLRRTRGQQDPRRAGRHADSARSSKVAVIGAGTMGGGITMNFLNAGIPVTMLEMKQDALDRGVATIKQELRGPGQEGQAQGRTSTSSAWRCLSTTLNYDDIKQADMVIEAVFEEMGVKEKVFKTLDEVMKPGAILASNTSTLDVDKIAVVHQAPAGRDRHALLQPGQRDEAAGSGARRKDTARMCWPP